MIKIRSTLCLFSIIISMVISGIAQSGGNFVITKSVIASGGRTTGGSFTLDATIGQAFAGTSSTGGIFELGGGFWGGAAAPASNVSISGRVSTPGGLGLRNAIVSLIDASGVRRTATTSSFGLYSFDLVATGQNYTMTVASKRFRYAPQFVSVQGTLTNVNFLGLE